ncbi:MULTISPECIES: hypothetical protein [unclassified Thiocapsa]|uniref:hypothetical protein n=1 Tax=unclassified Thiocapsa TaxID=2641286 RepID=UPI0035B00226
MAVFITIVSGVFVFVIGQTVLKLLVEPWQKQRECIAKIAHLLLYYENVYLNPGVGTEEKNREASQEARRTASELVESHYRIPMYPRLSRSGLFPNVRTMREVTKLLIGLSNSTHSGEPDRNSERIERIRSLLGFEKEN